MRITRRHRDEPGGAGQIAGGIFPAGAHLLSALELLPEVSRRRDRHQGVNAHTDSGAVTVLLQDEQPGLEVFHEGAWYLVEPRADALVVNIGDIVQVWSNDRYRAALHRAFVHADVERFSVAFFLNPPYSADYAPLPSVIDARHPARYRSINWGEFRSRRTAGDYAHAGEYAQISQYYL